MKLYNKTKCPDEILRPLLVAAGKSVGARTGKVIVKVTQSQSQCSRGLTSGHTFVYNWHLRRKRLKKKKNHGHTIYTDGGWFRISLPAKSRFGNYSNAKNFYEVAQHEWSHIKHQQQNIYQYTPRTPSGRRVAWGDRPCEIAAMNSVNDAKKVSDTGIPNLAKYLWGQ